MVNSLDIVIVFLILAGAYLGSVRGVLAETVSLIGLMVGIFLATNYCALATPYLLPILRDEIITEFITYIGLCGLGIFAFFLLYLLVKSNIAGGVVGPVSRLLGALLGAGRILIIVFLVVYLVIFFWGSDNSFTAGARLLPRFLHRGRPVVSLMPEKMREPLYHYLKELQSTQTGKQGE